jgi:hypothetical protein
MRHPGVICRHSPALAGSGADNLLLEQIVFYKIWRIDFLVVIMEIRDFPVMNTQNPFENIEPILKF